MKTLALVDVETTGLDPTQYELLEVGCVIWSVEHRGLVAAKSWLASIQAAANAQEATNGIALELVRDFGVSPVQVCSEVATWAALYETDVCVAYNADFDRQWVPTLHHLPWVCAMDDFEWPRSSSGKSLTAVALAHGVGVVDAHRALTDCLTMARLFERVSEMMDLEQTTDEEVAGGRFEAFLARAQRPKALFVNADRGYNVERNELYKAAGFRWHPSQPCRGITKGEKLWWRKCFVEDAGKLPFRVEQLT